MMWRYREIVLAAALVALARSSAAAAEPIRVGEAVPQSFTFTLLDFGMKRGIFAKEGVTIAPATFGGPVKQQQALAAGSIDVGLGVGLDLGFVAKGAPVKGVAAMAGPPLDTAIIVPPKSPIKTVADLKGRTVGISSLASILSWMIGEISVHEGWPRDAIHQAASGPPTAQVALLKSGQLDASGSDLAPALQLESSGDVRILVRFGDIITQSLNNVIFATDDYIATRPDDLRAFLKGWFATIAYARSHRDETIADMTVLLGIDRKFVETIYDRQMPMYLDDGHFPKAGLALIARAIVDVHMLDVAPDMEKLYTEAYLPK
jgi:NitT/TauT family transport system substrate-binding protein